MFIYTYHLTYKSDYAAFMILISVKMLRPMLAGTVPDGHDIAFPVFASPKIDGIRAMNVNGELLSRSMKPIPNAAIRDILKQLLPPGADGEISYGDTFQDCTSMVMSKSKVPEKPFTFYWFDYVKTSLDTPYIERMRDMRKAFDSMRHRLENLEEIVTIIPLFPVPIYTQKELNEFEQKCLDDGFEGVMVRSFDGPYKEGRSTLREGYLLKIKRFMDAEATVIGFEEMMHNNNEATTDAFGHAKRSSHMANKSASGTLGSFIVRGFSRGTQSFSCRVKNVNNTVFNVGSGLTAEQRRQFWDERDTLLGQLVKFKYITVGIKNAPRHPVFVGLRNKLDM